MIDVIIIGAGIAGIDTACNLHDAGYDVLVLEKEKSMGGNVQHWSTLFPTKRNANEVISFYTEQVRKRGITMYLNTFVNSIKKQVDGTFEIHTSREVSFKCKSVIIATGYSLFNAQRKEEYGYGIYSHVLTSADLEKHWQKHSTEFVSPTQKPLNKVAFIHCVGSRDEKSGNHYCSKVCCVTAVKQAITLKKQSPHTQVFCFYMDLRMYGNGFEEMYREAQETWGIQFIRGRLSEVAEHIDGTLQLKAEDTLSARPFKISVDMLVLMVGMESQKSTAMFAESCNVTCASNRFIQPLDHHLQPNATNVEGLFTAGACIGPLSVFDTLNHSKSATLAVTSYLK